MSEKDQGCKVEIWPPGVGPSKVACGMPCVAKGLCAKHYQQKTRGRLGKTKTIAAPGESAEIKVTTGKELKEWLSKEAKKSKLSVSEFARLLIEEVRKYRGH